MKKKLFSFLLISAAFVSTSAFIAKYQSGIAGYTGAPGESTCANCHGGGSSAASSINISSVPAFSANTFVPGTTYKITIDVAASGFSRFGFGCEILDDQLASTGSMQNAGSGVKFLNAGPVKNAVHTAPKVASGQASFSFDWVAPATGDTATIYAAANAVNGNGSTSGDAPIDPVFLQLNAKLPESEPLGFKENASVPLSGLALYPNPALDFTTISYFLNQTRRVSIQLVDLSGKTLRELSTMQEAAGIQSHLLDLRGIPAGVYFIKLSEGGQKLSQKLIALH